MMVIPRLLSRPQRKLPDSIFAELVAMSISGRVPIVVMALTVILVTFFAVSAGSFGGVVILAVIIVCLLAARFATVVSYRKAAKQTLSPEKVLGWEKRYRLIILYYAGFLGAFNVVASIGSDSATHLVIVAEIFGFCAGQVSRGSARPQLCAAAVLLGALPTAAAMLVAATNATDWREGAACAVVGLLIALYAFSSLETVASGYRTLVAQLESKRQMAGLARLDALTGLPNRLVFMEHLQLELARCDDEGLTIALHMIDLDGFKQINDNFGHPVGDSLLCAVSERLTRLLRSGDMAFRLGGDEFAVIQQGIAVADEANLLGRRIVRQLAVAFCIGEADLSIGASIGIAHAPGDTDDINELISYADGALYAAKRGGRGNVSIWRPGIPATATIAA